MPITEQDIQKSISIAKDFGVTRIILFGSCVDSPQNANDIDIACEGIVGWRVFELAATLEKVLQIPVDVVPLTPQTNFTKHIEKWGKLIYEQRKTS